MSKTSDLERTAYHEAGHAIVWLELCKRQRTWNAISDVTIIKHANSCGEVTFEEGNPGVNITEPNEVNDVIRFLYAGYVAERTFDPEIDDRLTRWNCRDDENYAITLLAFQEAPTYSEWSKNRYQISLVSNAQQKFKDSISQARLECERMLSDNWVSVDLLARCLLLCGRVNGRFARCCYENHEVPTMLLETVSRSAVIDTVRESLMGCKDFVVGPTTEAEEKAWGKGYRQGLR